MTRGAIKGALLALPLAILMSACQSADPAMGPVMPMAGTVPMAAPPGPMDGTWASTDGVFIATFEAGVFTSRFTRTNEILAQGSYSVAGDVVNMQWVSVATKQQRSAICALMAPNSVRCNQSGGGSFDLQRSA